MDLVFWAFGHITRSPGFRLNWLSTFRQLFVDFGLLVGNVLQVLSLNPLKLKTLHLQASASISSSPKAPRAYIVYNTYAKFPSKPLILRVSCFCYYFFDKGTQKDKGQKGISVGTWSLMVREPASGPGMGRSGITLTLNPKP